MTAWFAVRPVAAGVWIVAEPGHVSSWLVAGHDRAVLIDTGLGIRPVRPAVEAACGMPVADAVLTHAHVDHVGGNAEFSTVAAHRTFPTSAVAPAERASYLGYMRALLTAAPAYRDLDRRFFHLLDTDSDPRELPVDVERWVRPGPAPGPAPAPLDDGDVIDLGGRTLTVLHTPGHSPDSICLLDDRDGFLFAGDTVNTGPIYAQAPECDLADFARSTARLAGLDVSLVCMGHFGRALAEPRYLRDVAEGFDRLAAGDPTVALRDQRDCDDDEVREAVFDRFTVLLPARRPPVLP